MDPAGATPDVAGVLPRAQRGQPRGAGTTADPTCARSRPPLSGGLSATVWSAGSATTWPAERLWPWLPAGAWRPSPGRSSNRATPRAYPAGREPRRPHHPVALEGGELHPLRARLPVLRDRPASRSHRRSTPPRAPSCTARSSCCSGTSRAASAHRRRPVAMLARTRVEYADHPGLRRPRAVPATTRSAFWDDAAVLVVNLFRIEDPNDVQMLGTELRLEADSGAVPLARRHRSARDRRPTARSSSPTTRPARRRRCSTRGGASPGCTSMRSCARRPSVDGPTAFSCCTCASPRRSSPCRPISRRGVFELRAGAVWKAIERRARSDDFRPEPGSAVQLVLVPGMVPGLRRRPGRSPRPLRTGSTGHALVS